MIALVRLQPPSHPFGTRSLSIEIYRDTRLRGIFPFDIKFDRSHAI